MSKLSVYALLFAIFSPVVFAQTEANAFFDDTQVQVLNITMDPADWAALQQNYLQNTYYQATMAWNGVSVSLGIRSHGGGGSRSPVKPNLDFNFAHYTKNQTFLGLPFILLKANNEDPSNLHDWISTKLYRKMGLPATREAPAQLYINGTLLGFYYIVEHMDESIVQRNFGESGGYLYEWEYGMDYEFGNLGTDPSVYGQFLDLKTDQTSPDLQTFANFIQAVNQTGLSEAAYISGLSQYMDPKLFLSYCAIENVLSESDGVLDGISGLNNFYLYQFQGTTLYQMLAWDKDRTFTDPARSILDGVTTGTYINVLAQKLYSFPDYKAVYLSELTRAATLFGGSSGWAASEITREYNVINTAALNDPNKQCDYNGAGPVPCGSADFQSGISALQTFLATRSMFVTQSALTAGYQPLTANPQLQAAQLGTTGSAASQLSPGALATVTGTNFGASAQAANIPLPRILGTTFVAIDGVRAPLLSTSTSQIQLQVPGDLPAGTPSVVVSSGGAMSNALSVTTLAATPAILAVVRANGSAVTAGNAPVAGEYVTIYAIGLGSVTPDVTLGSIPGSGTVATTIVSPQVSLGGTVLSQTFSGLVPGYVGLYQVNAQLSTALPQGSTAQLVLSSGGQSAAVQIALQ